MIINMLNMTKNLFLFIINLVLYWLSFLVPRDKKLLVFGAWFGNKYADNSKYLYEYVLRNHPELKAVWMTRDKSLFQKLTGEGKGVCLIDSFEGYYISARAGFVFVSTGMFDVNRITVTRAEKIQLWHGTPLKYIEGDYKQPDSKLKRFFKKALTPYNISRYRTICAASGEMVDIYKKCFTNVQHVAVTGFPRNDILSKFYDEKTICYLPTHRGEGDKRIKNLFGTFHSDLIDSFLKSAGYKLFIKLHYYDLKVLDMPDTETIKFIRDDSDVYELMTRTSVLITDYSSIYFDYLLTQRPVIFAPFDIAEYLKLDRPMYFNYDEVTPGPKCKDWKEILAALNEFIIQKNDRYKQERQIINRMFNTYTDFNSCRRVLVEAGLI